MSTRKQREANRRNAQHSTGPRTPEGKQRTAQNAVTHGLSSKQVVIPGEDPADYNDLFIGYCEMFRPSNPYEHALVRQMADAEWRLRRISRLEAAFVSTAFEDRRRFLKEHGQPGDDANASYVLGNLMQSRTSDLTQFIRYEAQLRRGYQQAFKLLIEFRELETRDRQLAYEKSCRESDNPPDDFYRYRDNPLGGAVRKQSRSTVTPYEPTTSDPPEQNPSDEPAA